MRLINVETLELKEFVGDQIAAYAILSHTWGDQEVSFEEWTAWITAKSLDASAQPPRKDGYKKISRFCKTCRTQYSVVPPKRKGRRMFDFNRNHPAMLNRDRTDPAQAHEWAWEDASPVQWAWVDTCCMDKRSSAELSEAINSMFDWYERAAICVAYLVDFDLHGAGLHQSVANYDQSRYFERGWTLQELIAPRELHFYDRHWGLCAIRSEASQQIAAWTSIPEALLERRMSFGLPVYLTSTIFSWMAGRRTTRIEDSAYCLLGLFQVNMPLLYGEGERASFRLLEEVIKRRQDHSLLVWQHKRPKPGSFNKQKVHGLPCLEVRPDHFQPLAQLSPALDFRRTDQTLRRVVMADFAIRPRVYGASDWSMTLRGLETCLPVIDDFRGKCQGHHGTKHSTKFCKLAILSVLTAKSQYIGIYIRVVPGSLAVRTHANCYELLTAVQIRKAFRFKRIFGRPYRRLILATEGNVEWVFDAD